MAEPTGNGVGEINDAMRASIRAMNGQAKAQLASRLGVSVRTVQRWGVDPASGKQSRNYLPKRLDSTPKNQWPEVAKQRASVNRDLNRGMRRSGGQNEIIRRTKQAFRSLEDASKYMRRLAQGKVDEFLSKTWLDAIIKKKGDGWEVQIGYGVPSKYLSGSGDLDKIPRGPIDGDPDTGNYDDWGPDPEPWGDPDADAGPGD